MKDLILKHKAKTMLMVILAIIAAGTDIYSGYSLTYLYEVASSKNIKDAIGISVFLLSCRVTSVIFAYFSSRYNSKLTEIFNNDLRSRMLDKVVSLDIEKFNEKEPGEYASWLVSDINQIEKNSIIPLFGLVNALSTLIFAFVALLYIHNIIVTLTFISAIVLTIVPRFFRRSINNSSKQISLINERFSQKVYDLISGYEVFYASGKRNTLTSILKKIYFSLESEKFGLNKKTAQMTMFSHIIFRIFEMSITIVTAILAAFNIVSIGMIFSIANIVNRFFNATNSIVSNYVLVNSSKYLFDKFVFNEFSSDDRPSVQIRDGINLKNFAIQYGEKEIFSERNFEFKLGGKYAFVGESGSGKTSIAKAILGLNSNYRGNIYLDENDLKEYSKESILENIAYISQNVYIFNDTIRFNLTLGNNHSDEDILSILAKVNLVDFINSQTSGFDTILGDNGKNISGGQKQRLVIARALLQKKDIFIIDEGTSALDWQNSLNIIELLVNNPKYTLIFITHSMPDDTYSKLDKVYRL